MTDMPEEAMHRELGHLQVAEFLYETYAPTALVYAFKHALTQEVAYQSLVRRVRQQYHAHTQVLEKQFPEVAERQPEFLAQHYTEAGLAEQAIPYWQRAGQRAIERSANSEAVSHFTKGLEVLEVCRSHQSASSTNWRYTWRWARRFGPSKAMQLQKWNRSITRP